MKRVSLMDTHPLSVQVRNKHGFLIWVPLAAFVRIIDAEREHAKKKALEASCTRCGVRRRETYDGGAGRKLCGDCGRREGCKRVKPRGKSDKETR